MLDKAVDDYIEKNGWAVFILVILLTLAQLVTLAGVAYAHAHYPVIPIALAGDGAAVWGLFLTALVVVNVAFVWAVNKLVTTYAIRTATGAVALEREAIVEARRSMATGLAISQVNQWFITELRSSLNTKGLPEETVKRALELLERHDEGVTDALKRTNS